MIGLVLVEQLAAVLQRLLDLLYPVLSLPRPTLEDPDKTNTYRADLAGVEARLAL
ncbi:MAG TPA: hypothetical protein VGS14_05575 [Actinomycetes bacterium]|nr:hypothetical protein [Actinomycetes bacterium]